MRRIRMPLGRARALVPDLVAFVQGFLLPWLEVVPLWEMIGTSDRVDVSAIPWSPWRVRALVTTAACWAAVAALSTASTIGLRLRSGAASRAEEATLEAGLACLAYALLTPVVLDAGRRWPVKWSAPGALAVHAVGVLFYWLASSGIFVALSAVVLRDSSARLSSQLASSVFGGLVAYVVTIGLAQSLTTSSTLRNEELRKTRLEAELSRAQLNALTGQLRPHFLFNALNALSELIETAPATASRLVLQLSELLRLSLNQSHRSDTSLQEELEFLRLYVEVMQARIGPRLSVRWDTDARLQQARIPQLLLLPLIENALKHGVNPAPGPRTVTIHSAQRESWLCLSVEDDGKGLAADEISEGIGLSSTRRRLADIYGGAHVFRLERRQPTGVRSIIELPLRL